MEELKLTGQETDQLYVILRFFERGLSLDDPTMFSKDGPARKLAGRIAEHILPMGQITITK